MTQRRPWLSWLRRLNEGPVGRGLGWRGRRSLERCTLHLAGLAGAHSTVVVRSGHPVGSLFAVGDVALHRLRDDPADRPQALLGDAVAELRTADLLVGNLEAVLTPRNPSYQGGLAAPLQAVEFLAAVGFDGFTCANNHAFDCGDEGLAECFAALERAGIRWCGAGFSAEAAREPLIMKVQNLTLGMVGYTDDWNVVDSSLAARVAPAFQDVMSHDVAELRRRVDIVIVQLHCGYEWALHPLLVHRNLARSCVHAGADLVLCHHAHVPMAVEAWDNGIIAHGLGNLVFGWRGPSSHPWQNLSLGLRVFFSKAGVHSAHVVPFRETDAALQKCTSWRRREVLGALGLLQRGLQDEEYLAELQWRRITAEGARYGAACLDAEQANDQAKLTFLAGHLRTPRQRLVCRLLREAGMRESILVAAYLESIAATPTTQSPLRSSTSSPGDTAAISQAVKILEDRGQVPGDERGRLP